MVCKIAIQLKCTWAKRQRTRLMGLCSEIFDYEGEHLEMFYGRSRASAIEGLVLSFQYPKDYTIEQENVSHKYSYSV